jgi:hypothetical protein
MSKSKKLRRIPRETARANSVNAEDFFDAVSLQRDRGLRDDAIVHFYRQQRVGRRWKFAFSAAQASSTSCTMRQACSTMSARVNRV